MAYYDDIVKSVGLPRYGETSHSFHNGYLFWRNFLFEKCMTLFKWSNTGTDKDGGIDPKHLESIILTNGYVTINESLYGVPTAFYGKLHGIARYYDEHPNVMVNSPLKTADLVIGKDCSIICNNATRNTINHLVHRYAIMLAHTEVTLVNNLIDLRQSGGVAVASNKKQVDVLNQYRSALANGKRNTILDPSFLGVQFADTKVGSTINPKDLIEVRENILSNFYNDIGIRTNTYKKGNLIASEVHGNDQRNILNIDDMIEWRMRGAEDTNALFGFNWSVSLNPILEEREDSYNDNDNKGTDEPV